MPNTKQQQQNKLRDAAELIERGVTRAQGKLILTGRYGSSVGNDTWSQLNQERLQRVTPVIRQEFTKPVKYKALPKYVDAGTYSYLRSHGFNHAEGITFGSIREPRNDAGLQIMIQQRSELLNRFAIRAARNHYSATKRDSEWRKVVERWYRRQGYVRKYDRSNRKLNGWLDAKRRRLLYSPWDWRNSIIGSLPPGLQPGTPRHGRPKGQDLITPDKLRFSYHLNSLRRRKSEAETREDKSLIQKHIEICERAIRGMV